MAEQKQKKTCFHRGGQESMCQRYKYGLASNTKGVIENMVDEWMVANH